MMSEQKITIPRLPDRSVFVCFKKICQQHGVSHISVSAFAFCDLGNVNIQQEENDDLKTLLEHNSTLIQSCSIRIAGMTITFHRGGQNPPNQKSSIFDEIILRTDAKQGNLSTSDKLNVIAVIVKELKAFEPSRFIDTGLSAEQLQLLSIHESALERLEKLNEDLIRQSTNFREKLENRFDEKQSNLDAQFHKKQEELEEKYRRRNEAIKQEEKRLKDKLSAIDDRNNTHVRREIRDRMLEDVKGRIETFGVSKSTEGKRRPVMIGIILMILVIVLMIFYTLLEMNQLSEVSTNQNTSIPNAYWLWSKFTLLSFGLLGTILYYVKWQNRWAEQHSNSEFQLQQFYIDINRANWVIESCLEWRKETDSEIPNELLESITRNLFISGHEELEKVIHPSDELASALLGSASKLNMKVGDSELQFDKPAKINRKQKSNS